MTILQLTTFGSVVSALSIPCIVFEDCLSLMFEMIGGNVSST